MKNCEKNIMKFVKKSAIFSKTNLAVKIYTMKNI